MSKILETIEKWLPIFGAFPHWLQHLVIVWIVFTAFLSATILIFLLLSGPPQKSQEPGTTEITPLKPPVTDIKPSPNSNALEPIPSEAGLPMKVLRILEGKSEDQASRIFDLVLANESDVQIMLTRFEIRWHYYHGMLSSIDHGMQGYLVAFSILKISYEPVFPY